MKRRRRILLYLEFGSIKIHINLLYIFGHLIIIRFLPNSISILVPWGDVLIIFLANSTTYGSKSHVVTLPSGGRTSAILKALHPVNVPISNTFLALEELTKNCKKQPANIFTPKSYYSYQKYCWVVLPLII